MFILARDLFGVRFYLTKIDKDEGTYSQAPLIERAKIFASGTEAEAYIPHLQGYEGWQVYDMSNFLIPSLCDGQDNRQWLQDDRVRRGK